MLGAAPCRRVNSSAARGRSRGRSGFSPRCGVRRRPFTSYGDVPVGAADCPQRRARRHFSILPSAAPLIRCAGHHSPALPGAAPHFPFHCGGGGTPLPRVAGCGAVAFPSAARGRSRWRSVFSHDAGCGAVLSRRPGSPPLVLRIARGAALGGTSPRCRVRRRFSLCATRNAAPPRCQVRRHFPFPLRGTPLPRVARRGAAFPQRGTPLPHVARCGAACFVFRCAGLSRGGEGPQGSGAGTASLYVPAPDPCGPSPSVGGWWGRRAGWSGRRGAWWGESG